MSRLYLSHPPPRLLVEGDALVPGNPVKPQSRAPLKPRYMPMSVALSRATHRPNNWECDATPVPDAPIRDPARFAVKQSKLVTIYDECKGNGDAE